MQGQKQELFSLLLMLVFFHTNMHAALIAEYRFDKCTWDGTPDEITDTIGTYPATSENGTIPSNGKINNGADITEDNYISLSNSIPLDTWTISVWINFPLSTVGKPKYGNNYYYVLGSVEGRGDLTYFEHTDTSDVTWGVYDNNGKVDTQSFPDLTGWHHITIVNNKSKTKLYIDGTYENQVSRYTTGNLKYIGTSSDDPSGQSIGSILDEFKVYDTDLNATEIQSIYTNESIGNNHDGSTRDIPSCNVMVNYHFDECSWDGTPDEVIDSSGNIHATAENNLTTDTGHINNSAHFDGIDDYIDVGDNLDSGATDHWSTSVWFKWDGTSGDKIIYNKENLYETAVRSGYFQYAWQPHWNWDGDTSFPVTAGEWTHAVITYDGEKQRLYKNGTLVYERAQTGDIGSNSDKFLIGARGNTSPSNFFTGDIDEVKVFNISLTAKQITAIYTNENSSKNYNGTSRSIIECSIPAPVAEYRLDECKWNGTGDVKDSSINANHLTTITGASNISTGKINRAGQFDGVNGRIHGTWNQLFYTEVTLTAWINTSNPKGDNYARIVEFTDSTGSHKPGTAIAYDENGHSIRAWTANSSNSRTNIVSYDLTANGYHDGNWHFIAFTYKDGVSKLYVDNINVDNDFKDIGTIQTGETIAIGGQPASLTGASYKGLIDEVKVFDKALSPTHIGDIFDNESSGKNYGGDVRSTITCAQAILNAVNQNGGCFNWDNNITTKIASKAIDLTILSRDSETNATMSDINITQLDLLSFSDATCSTLYDTTNLWSGNNKLDTNGCFNTASFYHDKAIKCAKIKITALQEGTSIESNSTDTFSIRPERFTLTPDLTGKLTSEQAYNFQVEAKNYQSETRTPDFNQSLTAPTSKLRFREGSPNDGSLEGTFSLHPNNLNFSDGLTTEGNFSFNNVGLVTLEINDTTWADVDSDDTPLVDRTIYGEQNLTFIPDHFDIAFTSPIMINHIDGNFTYLSNDLNMSAWLKNLSARLSAKGAQGGLMTNYETPQSLFYANDINITTSLTVLNNPIMITAPLSATNVHLSFLDGMSDINYSDVRFNYPRDYKVPSEPIMIDGSDANLSIHVADIIDTSVTGTNSSQFLGDATFYYGRMAPEDVKTGENSVPSKSLLEIYSTTTLAGFERETSRWYINKEDNFTQILGLMAKEKRDIASSTLAYTSAENLTTSNKGKITYDVVNTHDNSYKAFYHFNIDSWLWHSRYSDYNATSNCSEHPCFEYIYESENANITGIKSGNLNGSSFANDFNTSTKRKAIKLLR